MAAVGVAVGVVATILGSSLVVYRWATGDKDAKYYDEKLPHLPPVVDHPNCQKKGQRRKLSFLFMYVPDNHDEFAKGVFRNDLDLYKKSLSDLGYEQYKRFLKGTKKQLLESLKELSEMLEEGDTLAMGMMVHGTQTRGTEKEPDRLAENLILADGTMTDIVFTQALSNFRKGVYIYMLNSGCHGTGLVNPWDFRGDGATILHVAIDKITTNRAMGLSEPYTIVGKSFEDTLKKIANTRKKRPWEEFNNERAANLWKALAEKVEYCHIDLPEIILSLQVMGPYTANILSTEFLGPPTPANCQVAGRYDKHDGSHFFILTVNGEGKLCGEFADDQVKAVSKEVSFSHKGELVIRGTMYGDLSFCYLSSQEAFREFPHACSIYKKS